MKKKLFILVFAFALTGCAYYSLLKPERRPIGALYTVETKIPWNKASEGNMEMWTVDGPLLEAVRFVNGLKDGESLLKETSKKAKLPHFRAHMSPSEVMEFFVASIKIMGGGVEAHDLALGRVTRETIQRASINAATVEAMNLRPLKFGALPGFRFKLRFLSKEGLEREGVVAGTVHEERLYLIVYTGTREYYFPKYKDEVEYIISSIELQK